MARPESGLLDAIATSRVPCMSIMNMPPLAYMRRIPAVNAELLKSAYTAPDVWERFDLDRITLCSPVRRPFGHLPRSRTSCQ